MAETKKVFKMFFPGQDNKEEEWLTKMASEGWNLKDYKGLYTFEKTESANYVYKIDYKATKNADLAEYKEIFEDSGWEHVTQFGGWQYFRTAAENGAVPDIYSDAESRIQKYTGLLRNLSIAYIGLVAMLLLYFLNPESGISDFTKGVFTGVTAVGAVVILQILFKVKKLKTEGNSLNS
ncbi:DUF2812 domain-containing protein [Bacillus sp. JJ1122]|uniref:DUF2812 domain-containing protein n=1 Tax=Bacillus sp. JJ1122 TaxID=3122951 RepID=UPI002FFE4DBA